MVLSAVVGQYRIPVFGQKKNIHVFKLICRVTKALRGHPIVVHVVVASYRVDFKQESQLHYGVYGAQFCINDLKHKT